MKQTANLLRALGLVAAIGGALALTSCASSGTAGLTADPDHNHPIEVAPTVAALNLSFATPAAGLLPQEEARFDAFVRHYRAAGNGSISVSVPNGPGSSAAISYFGERLAHMGVPRGQILVGTHAAEDGDTQVELQFITYSAHTGPCGEWDNAALTGNNAPRADFGCASQHNLAAMVADPRDLLAPRGMTPPDATRRTYVIQQYEQGQVTDAAKSADQSASTSTN